MRLIGVASTLDDRTGQMTIHQDYINAVLRAGALPVLLPLTDKEEALEEALRRIDGLLLTGGADVEPARYGEEKLPLCGETAPIRDRIEFFLCRRALEMDLPILAICRGEEVLSCALGGTLYQDIAAQYGDGTKHPCYDTPRDQVHGVRTAPGSLLRRITGLEEMRVNSRHHQGVRRLGAGLVACAWADDGLIEGYEMPGKRFVLAVQWHPESLSDRLPEAQALFNAFVEACV